MATTPFGTATTFGQMSIMALRYLAGRKLRTTLTTLAIVFGVALIFAMNLTMPAAMDAFRRTMIAASGNVDLSISSVSGESFAPDQPLQAVKDVENVSAVTGSLRRLISLPDAQTAELGDAAKIELIGVDPATVLDVREYVVSSGRFLEPGDTGVAVIPAQLAELAPQLTLGAKIPLMTANGIQTYTIVGTVANAGTKSRPQIMVTLADAQAAFSQPGLINTIDVAFKPGTSEKAVKSDIKKALGKDFRLDSTSSETDTLSSMKMGFAIFGVMGAIALFIGAFLIFNTFRTVILERRHDLAMLRAVGATRRQITQMILVESLIQGLIGTALGLLIGLSMALLMSSFYDRMSSTFSINDFEIDIRLSVSSVGSALAVGLLTTLLAGYWPARSAGRISPLDAMRPGTAADTRRAARWGIIAGAAIMAVAVLLLVASDQTTAGGAVLFMIGMIIAAPGLVLPLTRLFSPFLSLWFDREGDLARSNMVRMPGRAAITSSTLMIGLATVILIASMVSSFKVLIDRLMEASFSSDVMLTPQTIAMYGSVLGADEKLADSLRAIPDVQTVAGLRYASDTYKGQSLEILGINPDDYPKVAPLDFNQGQPDEAYAALNTERAAIVNTLTANTFGLKVGSSITLPTAEGEQTYRIVALADDLLHFKLNAFYISQANLAADFHKQEDVLIMIRLKPGADEAAALAAITTAAQDYPQFTVRAVSEYKKTLSDATGNAYWLFWGMAILILIPSALGLLNTLTINVMERTREIGIVRAVGGSRHQVRRIVTAEALLLGLFGAATGVLAGIAMSYGIISTLSSVAWNMTYSFPLLGIVAAVVLGILLALFSSILPARNAAKLDIIRALQYE